MSGEDKRTSCILRNLPNRMTQLELMEVGRLFLGLAGRLLLHYIG